MLVSPDSTALELAGMEVTQVATTLDEVCLAYSQFNTACVSY